MIPASGNATDDGWLPGVRRVPSPNVDERPTGMAICLVVIHAISLPPGKFGGDGILELFTNSLNPAAHPFYRNISTLRVSAHFLIRRDGELIQFASIRQRAWHAGVSQWAGRERCNDFSLGIELEGCDDQPFETAQYDVLNDLLSELRRRCPIEAVVGHADISPGRKTDPGPCFDWRRLSPPA
jgi:AmpD protein